MRTRISQGGKILSEMLLLASIIWPGLSQPAVAQSTVETQPAARYAFTDVNVVTMSSEQVLAHQTVVVVGEQIVAITRFDPQTLPPDATLIDGAGKYLLPGLTDMHTHLRKEYYLLLLLANGVTTVRNMDGTPQHLQWRAQIATGQRLGPTIFTTGPILDELPAHLPGPRPLATLAGARQVVLGQKLLGYDYLKVHDALSASSYHNLMTAAHELSMPVVGHVPDGVPVLDVIAAGQRSIEHLDGYFNRYPAEMPALIATLAAHDVWSCPALTCFQLLKATGAPPNPSQAAISATLSDLTIEFYDLPGDFDEAGYAYAPARAANRQLVAALQAADAPLLLGTDSPFPYTVPGFAVHQELQNLVDAGLSSYEALRIATYNAARFVDQLDQFGTVTVGKRADLLLLAANPLVDIGNTRQIVGVMVRGHWLPRAVIVQWLWLARTVS